MVIDRLLAGDVRATFYRITGRAPLIESLSIDKPKSNITAQSLAERIKIETLKFIFPIAFDRVSRFPLSEVAPKRRPTLGLVAADVALMAGIVGTVWGISGRIDVGIGTLLVGKAFGRLNGEARDIVTD